MATPGNQEFFERVGTDVRRGGSLRDEAAVASHKGRPAETSCEPPSTPHVTAGGGAMRAAGVKRWAALHDAFWGATQTHDELPPGLYRCGVAQDVGPVLRRQAVETDDLLELPDDAGTEIIGEFTRFWELEAEFAKRGFTHKRGYLLWGPPGSGKTSTLQLLIKRLIAAHQGIVLLLDHPDVAARCLQMVRQIEARRPVVAVLEDLDALVRRHGENEFLALLDGEAQIGRIVFLATTNYPERLDRRFIDRPSRFDTIRYLGMPGAAPRRAYLAAKEPSLVEEGAIDEWVKVSDGFSLAHLKECIIAVRCFGRPLEEVVARLEEMRRRHPNSEQAPDKPSWGMLGQANGRDRDEEGLPR